ncbi:MAG: phosphoenolpyruvate synthase [Candidatus Aenigmarchaeota archaeon]|nr:phosphoenolpyruvate synthase [Candidatus Aenigmarchaeota archaeon]
MSFVLWFNEISKKDVLLVGGKNANLGEMIRNTKVPVPPGFAITTEAYDYFLEKNELKKKISYLISKLDKKNLKNLVKIGSGVRGLILSGRFPNDLRDEIVKNYKKLSKMFNKKNLAVAVRSSATTEDLGSASFAGQQETYINVKGERQLLNSVKKCMASLFTDRAISYREDKGFDHFKVKLSVGVQKLVFSKSSGVMFSLDPDSGNRNFVYINSSWGLGDYVVQGKVNPDGFFILKPTMTIISKTLGSKNMMEVRSENGVKNKVVPKRMRKRFSITDDDAIKLAGYCIKIEKHYGRPMDMEWAKDGSGLYIVQARPETVHSSKSPDVLKTYVLKEKSRIILRGQSIGRKIGVGKVNVIRSVKDISKFKPGEVLVTSMTDPDWEPIMKIASGIITDRGGRTSHAAIVSRELGIPAVIGTLNGTKKLKTGQSVTVDCTGEEGKVWDGTLKFEVKTMDVKNLPKTRTKIMVNVGIPDNALVQGQLPVDGVGLAREEFIISSIGEHPLAMIKKHKEKIFVDKLSEGIAKIAAAFYPRPVILRFSDFKTNEYATLKGGKEFEPKENNPMIGWRGASRYISEFEPAFRLECRALKKVRDEMKLKNIIPMIPFCRTLEEAKETLRIMREEGLKRGKDLKVYVMAEIPSNIVLADKFSKHFDGFSIGSNDLTQLTLGIDRDSQRLAKTFNERDPAVKRMIEILIRTAHKYGRKVGICGEAPSYFPDFTEFLVRQGIDSISVNPEVAIRTRLLVHKVETKLKKK